jgi:hypothetical protein
MPGSPFHVALIEAMIARIKAERNEARTVVATGDVASSLSIIFLT